MAAAAAAAGGGGGIGEATVAAGATDTAEARPRRMAEETRRDDGRTPDEMAHSMAEAAERMGQAARRAAETGERIRDYHGLYDYRGEVRDGLPNGLGIDR
eukprot:GHVU01158158.1.p2 GENE.GHVU01158158.1~~GHVU01158158.1.p2  ORF type:complete len:109 (-),score=33.64 GHVU01158158.1:368-667(-)